jgi:AcrR family transcriptional regulator
VARIIPEDRLHQLVRVARQVFIEQGYRRTQMADVAEALGVAKGTVYLYVESKEALFDLVCRNADRPFTAPDVLPVPTPKPGATRDLVARRLAAALAAGPQFGPRTRLPDLVSGLYDLFAANREGLKLIDRAARDRPELGELWYGRGRGTVLGALADHLRRQMRSRRLRPVGDPAIAARFIVETCVFWAVHRHWDPAPEPPERIDDAVAKATVVDLVAAAFRPPHRRTPSKKGVRR